MADCNFTVLHEGLHDGYVTGLAVDEHRASLTVLRLFCRRVDGVKCVVTVPGVHLFRATNYLQGNIIFELRVYDADQCSPELVGKALHAECADDQEYQSQELEKMRRDESILLELVPSYGCELAAIARCRIEDIELETLAE